MSCSTRARQCTFYPSACVSYCRGVSAAEDHRGPAEVRVLPPLLSSELLAAHHDCLPESCHATDAWFSRDGPQPTRFKSHAVPLSVILPPVLITFGKCSLIETQESAQ